MFLPLAKGETQRGFNRQSSIVNRQSRALTLVEVMVTLAIFLAMALFMMTAVRETVAQWTVGERRRVLYERAAGALNLMANDIRVAATLEPLGATQVKVRFIGDYDANTKRQRLMFVRTFECGPERAITSNAGDGQQNDLMFQPPADPDNPGAGAPSTKGAIDNDDYTGTRIGDFKALGGMAAVAYFAQNRTLYRAIRAPVPQTLSGLLNPGSAQTVSTDVLYLAFDYWGQETKFWDDPTGKAKTGLPEKIWDSTRGITAPPLDKFFLSRGDVSLNDSEDDVFPQKVRITLTVDSPMPRCVYAKLLDDISESDGEILVESTKGFEDGGDDAYILIDDEWIRYRKKTPESFIVTRRGARNTVPTSHTRNAVIRTGKTFRHVVYIPNFRDDFSSDALYFARKEAQGIIPRRRNTR